MSGRPTHSRDNDQPHSREHKSSPRGAGSKVSPARRAAFEVLLRVAGSEAHSDDLLHAARVTALSLGDRNLATALVMGVLRWQIALDAQIAKLLVRPGQSLAEPVAISLRMGVFQLLHMDRIPAHAAINESVELCRDAGQDHAAGMVNAILRKVAAQAQAQKESGPHAAKRWAPLFELPAAFAERLGHPAWMVERWVADYGRDAALAICEYGQRELASGGLFGSPLRSLQIDDGSRLVAELAAAAFKRIDRAARVWDCCAAPGGKTLVLAERLPGAEILATDISAKRMARMEKLIKVTPDVARIQCEVIDAEQPASMAGLSKASRDTALFDLILCDAPCSGTGTLARNPEIRHRLRPEDLARQAARQRTILRGATSRLAPGGRLLYSTCSLEREENEQVIEAALAEMLEIQCISLEPMLTELAASNALSAEVAASLARTAIRNGCLRTLPGAHPCDGFFAALLERAN